MILSFPISYSYPVLLSSMNKGIQERQKSQGDRESLCKLLHLISIEFDFRFPVSCDMCNVVSQCRILSFKKFVITGEILHNSKAFNIQL